MKVNILTKSAILRCVIEFERMWVHKKDTLHADVGIVHGCLIQFNMKIFLRQLVRLPEPPGLSGNKDFFITFSS